MRFCEPARSQVIPRCAGGEQSGVSRVFYTTCELFGPGQPRTGVSRFRFCLEWPLRTPLKHHAQEVKGTLLESQDLVNAIDPVYRYPLRQAATDQMNRQLKSGVR